MQDLLLSNLLNPINCSKFEIKKLQLQGQKCLLKLERDTGHCFTHSWVATLALPRPRSTKDSSCCALNHQWSPCEDLGPCKSLEEATWRSEGSVSCTIIWKIGLLISREQASRKKSKPHSCYFLFRWICAVILTFIGVLETKIFSPNGLHKPLSW